MVANTTYQVQLNVVFSAAGTPDFKYALTGPASPVSVAIRREMLSSGTTATDNYDSAYTTSTAIVSTGMTGILTFNMNIINGVNAGTFAF